MKVIVPVAGVGTRLRPHTFSTPKALLHVAGRPILWHVLQPILRLQPEEVLFVIGFRGDDVKAYVEANYSFPCRFVHQDKLLGLGYALKLAMDEVGTSPTLVVLGDTIVECDLRSFVAAGDNVLGLREVADPHRFGIAELDDGYVSRLEEKPAHPRTNLAVVGLYYFRDPSPAQLTLRQLVASGKVTRGEIQFTDALEMMIQQGTRFKPFEVQQWFDCGKKETLLETNRHLLGALERTVEIPGSAIIPPIYVAPGAVVRHSVLGPHVSISEGARVESSVLRNCIVGPNATIQHVVLEDSLVGHHVSISGAVKRLNVGDTSEVVIS